MSMLRKKEIVTIVTPIPGFIPRQLAIDILHSHSEVITLNPLVLDHKPIKAPRDAASDEYYATWYEIVERIQYVPGLGKMGSGKIAFNGCFHNMPWGLQAHIYAPMNTDLRYKYRIAGNQPGIEPPETLEMGLAALGAPRDGLYLREDVEVKCSIAVMGFVKSQLKAASKLMVERIIKKAELVDAGVLHAMFEDGKLKTVNPADRSQSAVSMSPASSPSPAPTGSAQDQQQDHPRSRPLGRQSTVVSSNSQSHVAYQTMRPQSMQNPYGMRPGSSGIPQAQGHADLSAHPVYTGYQTSYPGHAGTTNYASHPGPYASQQPFYPTPYGPQGLPAYHAELQAYPVNPSAAPFPNTVVVEMPGDFHHQTPHTQATVAATAPSASTTPQSNRESDILAQGQWPVPDAERSHTTPGKTLSMEGASPPSSAASDSSSIPFRSPGLDKNFISDLATHRETLEEHRAQALQILDSTTKHD